MAITAAVAVLAAGGPALAAVAPQQNYIVQFNSGVNGNAQSVVRANLPAGSVGHVFHHAIQGFTAKLNAGQAAALAANPAVKVVEADGVFTATDSQSPTPSWGLDRIDQSSKIGDSTYNYPANPGSGVRIYVVDTGTQGDNPDFTGRVLQGYNAIGDGSNPNIDCQGHGTHVAGTAAGTKYGVAKKATIVPVKVLSCAGSGSWSSFINGLNWIIANNPAGTPAVATASLGGSGISTTVLSAVANLTNAGIPISIAAGNSNADACNFTPAAAPSALTIGASDSNDARASFSNYGNCVDLFAPGVAITSDDAFNPTGSQTWNGTSMATPHVAGVIALYLQQNPTASVASISTAITTNATQNVVTSSLSGSFNDVLNMSFLNNYVPPTPTAPATPAAPTASARYSNQINLSWTAPSNGGSAITGYRVESYNGTSWVSVGTPTGTTFSVTGLSASTNYSFRVVAINAIGESTASAALNTSTISATPAVPTNIRVSTATTRTGAVTWTASPVVTFGTAISYQVRLYGATGTLLQTQVTSSTGYTFTN
ncbi:MAG: S8 family serine peptidase, partial [Micrococcales bacterium]